MIRLRRMSASECSVLRRRRAVDGPTLDGTRAIVEAVERDGDAALRRYARELDGMGDDEPLVLPRAALERALAELEPATRELLERCAERIAGFAAAQREALRSVEIHQRGVRAGHSLAAVERAGCYAPGGRYPLPSSVLMTAVTAKVAGVGDITVATPSRSPIMQAAAALAGADRLLCVGGAHAIAAMAHGTASLGAVDVIVGPGNRWVTAAKQIVSGRVGIDMLAGPSELVVIADERADPEVIAADLLAQAEHDADALPVLLATTPSLIERVERELDLQLASLPTREVAERALESGFAVCCEDLDQALAVSDALAPEHVELLVAEPEAALGRLQHYGAAFVGAGAAEVLGDYGAGPNHVLPTGQGARFGGGLSVLHFVRLRTWLVVDDPRELARDAAALARLEGLEGHARAAERRL